MFFFYLFYFCAQAVNNVAVCLLFLGKLKEVSLIRHCVLHLPCVLVRSCGVFFFCSLLFTGIYVKPVELG